GTTISTKLHQRPTASEQGQHAVVAGWIEAISAYLGQNDLAWEQVAGVGEAQRVRGSSEGGVLMLAPGSGLGTAYIDARGLPLEGDTLAGMETAHMPAPLHLLGAKAYPCGCGRTWGCVELYTTLAGLPYLLAEKLPAYPDHPLAKSTQTPKEKALALRGLA